MKIKVKYFVSYAHKNSELASRFLEMFIEQTKPSARYSHESWRDTDILVGENWDAEIQSAIASCSYGLLLVSPAFLGSDYIVKSELPQLMKSEEKLLIPVVLQPIDLIRHDLHGLDKYQLFRLDSTSFSAPRSFYECKRHRRNEFAAKLFEEIESRLDKSFAP